MDSIFALQTLLDSLLKCHNLMGWKIFPEKSGSILINIRVVANKEALSDFDMAAITSCRKLRIISPKQLERNSNRAKKHSESLSQRSDKPCGDRKPPDLYTDPRNKIENSRSNDLVHQSPISSMPSPDLGHIINVTHSPPDALITCSSPSRSECESTKTAGSYSEIGSESHANTNASFIGEDDFRRPPPFVQSKTPPEIPDEIPGPEENDDFYEIIWPTNGGCRKGHCFFRERSGPGFCGAYLPDSHYDWSKLDIYMCDACQLDNTKFCINCINAGAHEPHRPWLRTF